MLENVVILALAILSQYTNITDDDDRQTTHYGNSRTLQLHCKVFIDRLKRKINI